MSDEPDHGTKTTDNSHEAANKVSEHASKAAQAASEGRIGDAVKHAAKVVGYGAQAAGHTVEGN